MAMTIHCDIVSAEEEIFSGLIEMLVASGAEGELGVSYGHAPLLTSLVPGPVRIIIPGGDEEIYYVSGGFLEVQPGVVSILAPDGSSLLGLISNIAPAIVGGNTCVILASEKRPLCAISFAEVLHASDVPGGVVNILTGFQRELTEYFASHMDVNAVVYCDGGKAVAKTVQELAANNIKRVIARNRVDWSGDAENPYLIRDTQEVKTTWHPVGT